MRAPPPKETIGAKALQFHIFYRRPLWRDSRRHPGANQPAGQGVDHTRRTHEKRQGTQSTAICRCGSPAELGYRVTMTDVFPAVRGGQLSDMTIAKVAQVDGMTGGCVRSPRHLPHLGTGAHSIHPTKCASWPWRTLTDSTRAAYARSELIDKRRLLMNDWSGIVQRQSRRQGGVNSGPQKWIIRKGYIGLWTRRCMRWPMYTPKLKPGLMAPIPAEKELRTSR